MEGVCMKFLRAFKKADLSSVYVCFSPVSQLKFSNSWSGRLKRIKDISLYLQRHKQN